MRCSLKSGTIGSLWSCKGARTTLYRSGGTQGVSCKACRNLGTGVVCPNVYTLRQLSDERSLLCQKA